MNRSESTLPSNGQDARVDSRSNKSADETNPDASAQDDIKSDNSSNINPDVRKSRVSINSATIDNHPTETNNKQQTITVGRFFSVCFNGSLEKGYFESINDVYVKYSIIAGSDWIQSYGTSVGITQIARYRLDENGTRQFVWNQPITVSFKSYNCHGWPQIVFSVYNLDIFSNDQPIGYGCTYLPILSRAPVKQTVKIYSPQSTSYVKHFLSWITGKKPELVDSNLFARGDCRSVLQTSTVGEIELLFNITSREVNSNSYRVK